MNMRKRVVFGKWYHVDYPGGGFARPIGRVKNNEHGDRVYRCETIRHSCCNASGYKRCKKCNRNNYSCFWIGFLGAGAPKLKCELLK